MKLSRPIRWITATIMLFSLLFAQLAVAAYACPVPAKPLPMGAVGMPDMPGCTDMKMDKDNPALCAAHCDAGHQSADTSGTPVVQPFVPCALELVLPRNDRFAPSLVSSRESVPMTHATAPPLAIRHCCFRI